MNYLTHGRRFLHDPYFLAGTAIPDWLNLVDRKMRVRSKSARLFVEDDDPHVAAIARGVVQHHHDDDWFHQSQAFAELSMGFTVSIRDALPKDDSFRPSFLGHILVELLLDDTLATQSPGLLDAYYDALRSLIPVHVQDSVNRMATRTSERIVDLIPRFCQARFLYDYGDDETLLKRINGVMKRVKLAPFPIEILRIFPAARRQVLERQDELLSGEQASANLRDIQSDEGDMK